ARDARDVAGAVGLPDLLGAPRPRAGLLWTAGSAAGLPFEAEPAWGSLHIGRSAEDGTFRRPLDPEGVGVVQLDGLRWQPLGRNGSVIGRVVADRTVTDRSPFTPGLLRHRADPFVVTDTIEPAMVHVRTRVEGAYAWAWNGWSAGLAAGVELSDDRTEGSRLPRFVRESVPGGPAGIARRVGEPLALSLYGRWTGGAEAQRIVAVPAVQGVVFLLHGFDEPEPVRFSTRVFTRAIERN